MLLKVYFIRLLYGGSFDNWAKDNNVKTDIIIKQVNKLQEEIKYISLLIEANNTEIKKLIEKKKNCNIKSSSILSLYLQEIENQILEEVYIYCLSTKYILNNSCVLCFDGIMLLKDHYKTSLLTELQELIQNKFNLSLNFVEKSLDKYYNDEELENKSNRNYQNRL